MILEPRLGHWLACIMKHLNHCGIFGVITSQLWGCQKQLVLVSLPNCKWVFVFFLFCPQVFLKSDRVARMVQSGGCSANDFREVFKKNIEKRVRSLPEIDGLSKETVLSSWIAKYDAIYRGEEDLCKQPNRMALSAVSELILSKEQLYEMFQQILGIKKLEHQLLYNACQVSAHVPSLPPSDVAERAPGL